MISGKLNLTILEETESKYTRIMGPDGWEEYRRKINDMKVSNLIDNRNIQESYREWSNTIMEVKESCMKKVKIRRPWKVNRILIAEKKRITRKLRNNLDHTQIQTLKIRKEILLEEIEKEEQGKEYARIKKIVEDVQRAGGVKSSTFMEVRKKLKKKADELPHAMINKEGKKCDQPDEIREIYKDWYSELLKTKEGETDIEKGAEEIVNLMWNSMEAIANSKPPEVLPLKKSKQ